MFGRGLYHGVKENKPGHMNEALIRRVRSSKVNVDEYTGVTETDMCISWYIHSALECLECM